MKTAVTVLFFTMFLSLSYSNEIKSVTLESSFDNDLYKNTQKILIDYFRSDDPKKEKIKHSLKTFLKRKKYNNISSYFILAKTFWLTGLSNEAIDILKTAIDTFPEKKYSSIELPVSIIARLWMCSIHKEYGNLDKAVETYIELKKFCSSKPEYRNLNIIFDLYLADIYALMKRDDMAVRYLNCVEKIHRPKDENQQLYWIIYRDWCDYKSGIMSETVKQFVPEINRQYLEAKILIMTNLALLNGTMLEPATGYYSANSGEVILYNSLRLSIVSKTNPVDRSISMFFLGFLLCRQKKYSEGEKYLRMLWEGESFFAPEGALFLLKNLCIQKKNKEYDKISDEIRKRFPAYGKMLKREFIAKAIKF